MSLSRRGRNHARWVGAVAAIILPCLLPVSKAAAADAVLDVVIGAVAHHFARDELLRRSDVSRVTIASDIAYGRAMNYLAVPVAALLGPLNPPAHGVIEAVAVDGFAAQLPVDLLIDTSPDKAIAWLAIEPADAPWPALPRKNESAGPFYIVWKGPNVAAIRSEQWPYQIKRLETQPSPLTRWPELDVDAALPATDPSRAGLALYKLQCLPCHMLNGAGAGTAGPDLNRPMNPTQYMTREGLHALIRDPRSVRSWPGMQMPGFAPGKMSDRRSTRSSPISPIWRRGVAPAPKRRDASRVADQRSLPQRHRGGSPFHQQMAVSMTAIAIT